VDEKEFYKCSHEFLHKSSQVSVPLSSWRRLLNRFLENRFEVAAACLETGLNFVDLGCDDGQLAMIAAKKYSVVHGVDISSERVKQARDLIAASYPNRVGQFLVANLNRTFPFPDASMDAIGAIAILEHVFDVYFFVRECHRILTSQGIIVIEVPNVAYLKNRIRLLMGRIPITSSPYGWAEGFGWDGGHLHYFTKGTIEQLLNSQGFKVKRITTSRGPFISQRNVWASLLAGTFLVKAVKV